MRNEKDSRTIIMACPVGTSLSGNVKKEPWQELEKFLNKFLQNGQIIAVDQATAYFGGAVESWAETLPSLKTSFPTAELQSIVRWLLSDTFKQAFGEKPLKIDLRLFPSEDSRSCATAYMTLCVLQELQSRTFWDKNVTVDVKKPEPLNIQVENAEVFDESIGRLFEKYDKLRGGKVADEEMMINATGGYKAVCAFSSIYAQLHDLRCIYTFEGDANTAIELPPLPLSYSLEALDDEISILKGLENPESLAGMDTGTLPAWLRNLFPRKGKGISPMRETLRKHYEDRRGSAEAVGSGMLDQLGPDARDVRDYLDNCIKTAWSQLWLGDQIPETVEHSRRHSKRLMELAGNLYRCAPDELGEIGMRKPETLALLISAIYLHDIGHTLMAHPVSEDEREALGGVFPLGSFPSCVREVHHLLSAEVIDCECRKGELFPEGGIGKNFREMLMELVPRISEHHRGYTTLRRKQGASGRCKKTVRSVGELLYGEKFAETLQPLEKRLDGKKEKIKRWNLSSKEVVTVTALLRVLDGCDVQADRVVSQEYMRARLARTKAEGEAIRWELLPLLRGGWEKFAGPCDRIHEISRHLQPEDASQGKLAAGSEELESLCKGIYAAVMDDLLALKAQSGGVLATSRNRADLTTLSLVNRYAFKWEQFLHFYKHRCVGFVLPVRKGDQVLLKIFPDRDFVGGNQEMQNNLDRVREEIQKEIEYTDGLIETILTPERVCLA